MTARIHRLPAGLPYTVVLSGGREVAYLWHRPTDTYEVERVEGDVSAAEIAAGESSLRALAET
jgi:hypothetical protein